MFRIQHSKEESHRHVDSVMCELASGTVTLNGVLVKRLSAVRCYKLLVMQHMFWLMQNMQEERHASYDSPANQDTTAGNSANIKFECVIL